MIKSVDELKVNGKITLIFTKKRRIMRTVLCAYPCSFLPSSQSLLSSRSFCDFFLVQYTEIFCSLLNKTSKYLRFEVFTAVTIKNVVFWDVAPCRYFVNRRFGGTYLLHLHGIRNPRAMNQCEQVALD
jgi:hypothetical protein